MPRDVECASSACRAANDAYKGIRTPRLERIAAGAGGRAVSAVAVAESPERSRWEAIGDEEVARSCAETIAGINASVTTMSGSITKPFRSARRTVRERRLFNESNAPGPRGAGLRRATASVQAMCQ